MRSSLVCVLVLFSASFLRAEEVVDFERQIVPLLAKHSCNSGACHGSFDGRGGFRLSLFSYDPAADYRAITRGGQARRINLLNPEESLLLKKPLLKISHQGGRRFADNSRAAGLLRAWIAQGANHNLGSGRIERIWIASLPRRINPLADPGRDLPFRVRVRFADGVQSDVTGFAELRTQDPSIANVAAPGRLKLRSSGETVLIARYLGGVATRSLLIPKRMDDRPAQTPAVANRIDLSINEKLADLGISPVDLSSDAEFLRRISLHTIGKLPTPDEVRSFLSDDRLAKRRRKIDQLLAHPLHAAMWATRFSEWTGNDMEMFPGDFEEKIHSSQMWQDWFRDRFAKNVPYDQIVRGVLCSVSRTDGNTADWIESEAAFVRGIRAGRLGAYPQRSHLDLFWRRGNDDNFPAEDVAERMAAWLLGVRVQCAQCHKHPFDRWTQTDYRAFANIFTQVRHGQTTELRVGILDALDARRNREADPKPPPLPKLSEIYLTDRFQDFEDPAANQPLAPEPLGGPPLLASRDRREQLADWLVDEGKQQFARAFVNRVWATYFGRGLVEPLDAFSATNPPTHPELLEWLAREFLASGFDVRHVERLLLNSETYQRSTQSKPGQANDPRNYAQSQVEVLPAAVAVDVLHDALGKPIDWGNSTLSGKRAIEVGATSVRQELVGRMFELFQRPERKTPCDCERTQTATVRQSLFLMSDEHVLEMMRTGRLKALLESELEDEKVVEELYLAALSRFPTAQEQKHIREYLDQAENREDGFEGVWWALLNTREFFTIH